MEALAPDAHVLTRCLRPGRDEGLRAELNGSDAESWRRLVDEAIWHGVAPLLYHRLRGLEPLSVPAEQLHRLRDLYHHSLLMNRAIGEQLSEVVGEITGAGYSVLALKGAYLVNCVYEEAALRPMGDIDLLVRPDDAQGVQRHLMSLGYRHAAGTENIDYTRLHHLRPLSKPGLVDVEVHHDLAPTWAPFRSDLVGLWHRSMHSRVDELELAHLAPDDLLLHLCTHAAYNDEFRVGLRAACDVDAVVRRLGGELDWGRLAETANAAGRARFAYVTLRLSRGLLDTPIPDAVLASLHHDEADDGVAREVVDYVFDASDRVPTTIEQMGDATTVRAKLAGLWRGVFPPPDTLRRIYRLEAGSKLQYLYYALRPLDLLLRRGRQVAGLLTRSSHSEAARERERRRRAIAAWARGTAATPP